MHQDLLNSIAGCWVVHLGVDTDAPGRLHVYFRVDVDMADAISMAEHRNAGVVLDVRDQLVGSSGDDLRMTGPLSATKSACKLVMYNKLAPHLKRDRRTRMLPEGCCSQAAKHSKASAQVQGRAAKRAHVK